MSVTTHSNAWSVWMEAELDRAPDADPSQPGLVEVAEAQALVRPRWRPSRLVHVRNVAAAGLIVLVAAAYGFLRPQTPPKVGEPAPTSTPAAPGIVVIPSQKFDLPDPMFVTADGQYHAYFSTAFLDRSHANVPELIGADGQWGREIDAFPRLPAWARDAHHHGQVWAPYVERIHGQWLMYFAATLNRTGPRIHCLGVARSVSASGPFVAVGADPLECQSGQGGDIDVQPFEDPSGPNGARHPWYVVWKSDNNNLKPIRPNLIWSAPLADDGLSLAGAPQVIFRSDLAWQAPILEAPQMVRSPSGELWLFYSAGQGFYTAPYSIGVASCPGPIGPCHDVSDGPLVASNDQGAGPGEETVFVAPDGSYWLLYNPWHTGLPFELMRPAEGVRIGWNAQGPYVAEAGAFPSPAAPRKHPTHATSVR